MKVFISQPMGGKTDEQIKRDRDRAVGFLECIYKEKLVILDSIFDLDEGTHPLVYLGKSLELMADADLVFFMEGWDESRGCVIEHEAAVRYGIQRRYFYI